MINKSSKLNVSKKKNENSVEKDFKAVKRTKNLSNYGKQLQEKQKIKKIYGMREKQFKRFFKLSVAMRGSTGENLLSFLERRLDNVIFRLKLSMTRSQARQMIVHGHVLVNGKKVTAPSFFVDINDIVSLSEKTKKMDLFMQQAVEKRFNTAIKVPEWLEILKKEKSGQVLRSPTKADLQFNIEEHLIVELYSK